MNAIEMKLEIIEDLLDELECATAAMRSWPMGSEERHDAYLNCKRIHAAIKAAKSK